MKHNAFFSISRHTLSLLIIAFLTFCNAPTASGQFYYGTTQNYGKERPVYNRFEWNYMRFPSYDVFYYKNGVNNARFVASILPEETKKLDEYFGGTIEVRFQVICFNSLTDLKQSNILGSAEEKYDLSGITQAIGYKIFIYGTGTHEDLRRQVRSALMEVYLNFMVGGGIKKSETIRDIGLADWFTLGLTAYYGTPDITPEMLEMIKDKRSSGRFKNMKMYNNADATTLGYSIWYYLHNRYGAPTAARIVTRSIMDESERDGIKNTLGIPLKQVNRDWAQYFSQIFSDSAFVYTGKRKKMPSIPSDSLLAKTKYQQRIDHFTVDKTGQLMAYVVGEDGMYSVFVKDLASGKKKKIISGGYRIPQNRDASVPLLAFTGKKNQIAVVSEEKGDIFLRIHDIKSHKKVEYRLSQIDKVISLDFAPDGTTCVFSAIKNGYSDLYLYSTKSGALRQLTNDSFDDISPRFYPDGQSILFSSTRVDDTLRNTPRHSVASAHSDLFVYKMNKGNIPLSRLSTTSGVNESYGIPIDASTALYTDDASTELKLRVVKTDSTVSHVDTTVHYRQVITHFTPTQPKKNILSHDVTSYMTYYKNRYALLPMDTTGLTKNVFSPKDKKTEVYKSRLRTPFPVDIYNYKFENQISNRYSTSGIALTGNPYSEDSMAVGDTSVMVKNIDASYYEKFKRMYRRTYFPIDVNATITDDYKNLDYEPFTGGPVSPPSGFGGGVSMVISDKMQDYSFIIGLGTDFSPLWGHSLFANGEFVLGFRNDHCCPIKI
ncbi:MAG: hypothetical protein PHD21_06845 [Flavobacteriales bacterium]|nr:hypothetical protein [Flavobacteriales bacterium]